MIRTHALALPALLSSLTLAACAPDTARYPSLLPRATESQGFAEPAAPPPAVAQPDPALDAQIESLRTERATRAAAFDQAFARAQRLSSAARGAAEGSDAWIDAQTALGELDVARADAREPLATLEQLAADRAVAGLPPYPALASELEATRAAADDMTKRSSALDPAAGH